MHPLRAHSGGSLAMNRALMAAGLVDRVQMTIFPVITGQTGMSPIFHGAQDFQHIQPQRIPPYGLFLTSSSLRT